MMGIFQKPFTMTQASTDTASEVSIATNIQPGITLGGWQLQAVEFTLKPDLVKSWAAVDQDLTFQITKRSLVGAIARIVTYTDTDLIMSYSLAGIASGTVANMVWLPTTYYIAMPPGVLIYSENLYIQMISTATGQTNVAWGRIMYTPITLTKDEAFNIVASRP